MELNLATQSTGGTSSDDQTDGSRIAPLTEQLLHYPQADMYDIELSRHILR